MSNWPVWIGLRYLYSKKNTKFLSFITVLAFLGIALGVCSMIVVLSVMSGFEVELKKRLFSGKPHVVIEPTVQATTYKNGYVVIPSPMERSMNVAVAGSIVMYDRYVKSKPTRKRSFTPVRESGCARRLFGALYISA